MPEMTTALKEAVLEEIKKLVLIGFEVKAGIFITIVEDMFDEDDMDKDWVKQMIDIEYDQHQQASKSWARPTDFDRLAKAFNELIQQRIIALHNAGIEIRDGRDDSREIIQALRTHIVPQPIGSCFYHFQDLEGVVNPEYRSLFLAFGSVSNDDVDTVAVGKIIYTTLQQNGFDVTWNGTADERIRLNNVSWQKVPDDIDYSRNKVIALFMANAEKVQIK